MKCGVIQHKGITLSKRCTASLQIESRSSGCPPRKGIAKEAMLQSSNRTKLYSQQCPGLNDSRKSKGEGKNDGFTMIRTWVFQSLNPRKEAPQEGMLQPDACAPCRMQPH